jgi:hypothetical protein
MNRAVWFRYLAADFNDRFGDISFNAARNLLQLRGNAALAIAAPA